MPYLSWISDSDLLRSVSALLGTATTAKQTAISNMGKNVVDPFSAVFEMAGFHMTYSQWEQNEQIRQAQKTLQNNIGNFHQIILGSCAGWSNMRVGNIVDLVNPQQKVIAEVKNKYNTVKGSNMVDLYKSLQDAVMNKTSIYKDFTAYHVAIIPKSPIKYDKEFTTSDQQTGAKVSPNRLIRQIDGASFYKLVTGDPNALKDLFIALPAVIAAITSTPSVLNSQQLNTLFKKAYG